MLLLAVILLLTHLSCSQLTQPCFFNSMCSCRFSNSSFIRDVSCVGVPFYKLPDLPHTHISHLDIVGAGLDSVDDSLAGQVETLRLITNNIISISDRTFASMASSLRSLDLSQNRLEEVPMRALCYLKALNWLNLHSNKIPSLDQGEWCHFKDTLDTLFLGENELLELPSEALLSLRRLTWLSLDHNLLTNFDQEALPESLKTLSVQNNYLQEIPRIESLNDLSRIILRSNFIRKTTLSTRHNKQLEKLDLGDNFIDNIKELFINNSITIRDISLDMNRILNISDETFKGTNAGRIILALNRIDSISTYAFSGLENSLEYIDLERNHLTSFPVALSQLKKLKFLYLPYNDISYLNDTVFHNFSRSLKALSLAGNKLKAVPRSTLSKCIKLAHINLGYNQITDISPEDFEGWGEFIDTVLLQNNHIIGLSNNLFKNTPHLRELSLSFNRLIDIENNAFVDVAGSLESLEISFGLYRDEFPEEFLVYLTSLVWLALDNNNLRVISGNALNTFKKLQYLNLDSNLFTEIPYGLFNGSIHKQLRDIRLSYNHINLLESKAFSNLSNVQTIILSGNNIITVHSGAFENLPNLITVLLSQNRINTLHPGCFRNIPKLMKLDLQLNEIREFSLNALYNVTDNLSMILNISRNEISSLAFSSDTMPINIRVLDVSHNRLAEVPTLFLQFMIHSLTRLNIGYNVILQVHPFSFANLSNLEVLHLEHNGIVSIRRKAFYGLSNLQDLDLSHNHIKSLQVAQFATCNNLRIVDLSFNHIRTLPKDAFQNSRIERLDLSNNEFIVFPNLAFGDIGFTLRHLDVSHNQIDRIDSTMFHETQFLTNLNLCHNKLNILPDNVFTSIGNLLHLSLCSNPLTANFKELLHYIPKLRYLNIGNIGLKVAPMLPLPKLTHLNISGNHISELPTSSIETLTNLRSLILRGNKLSNIPTNCWSRLRLLRRLDISDNLIKVISQESFQGLRRLDYLNLKQLYRLEKFDPGSLSDLRVLTSLELES